MLTITDIAKDKIKEVLVNNPGKSLRIFVRSLG